MDVKNSWCQSGIKSDWKGAQTLPFWKRFRPIIKIHQARHDMSPSDQTTPMVSLRQSAWQCHEASCICRCRIMESTFRTWNTAVQTCADKAFSRNTLFTAVLCSAQELNEKYFHAHNPQGLISKVAHFCFRKEEKQIFSGTKSFLFLSAGSQTFFRSFQTQHRKWKDLVMFSVVQELPSAKKGFGVIEYVSVNCATKPASLGTNMTMLKHAA